MEGMEKYLYIVDERWVWDSRDRDIAMRFLVRDDPSQNFVRQTGPLMFSPMNMKSVRKWTKNKTVFFIFGHGVKVSRLFTQSGRDVWNNSCFTTN